MKISKIDLCIAWVACFTMVIAVNWNHFSGDSIPLAGMKQFSELNYSEFLAYSSMLPALWLSIPSLHSAKSLNIFRWLVVVIGLLSMFFLSIPYGGALLVMSTAARDAAAKHKPKYAIDIRKQ